MKTVEEHLINLRENVPGFRRAEAADAIAKEVIRSVTERAKAQGKPVRTVGVSEEHVAAVMAGQDVFIAQIIRIVQAVLDLEASQPAPAGAGGGAVAREGAGARKETRVFEIAKPGASSASGAGK